MRLAKYVLALALAILGCGNSVTTSPSLPFIQQTVASNSIQSSSASVINGKIVDIPFDARPFVPCANNGVGEIVVIFGLFRERFHITNNPNIVVMEFFSNSHEVFAFGHDTGTKYEAKY